MAVLQIRVAGANMQIPKSIPKSNMQIPIHLFRSIQTWAFFVVILPTVLIYFDRGVAFLQVLRDPFEWPRNGRQDSWSTNTAEAVWDAEFMRFHLHKELEHRDCKSLLDGVAAGVSVYKTLKPRSFLGDQESFLMRYDAVKVWILWSSGTNHFGLTTKVLGRIRPQSVSHHFILC